MTEILGGLSADRMDIHPKFLDRFVWIFRTFQMNIIYNYHQKSNAYLLCQFIF